MTTNIYKIIRNNITELFKIYRRIGDKYTIEFSYDLTDEINDFIRYHADTSFTDSFDNTNVYIKVY